MNSLDNSYLLTPIVVPGLSASSSSSLPSPTSMTSSMHEIDHPTSSSSSSTSPTMTSSTVSSESVAGQERERPVWERLCNCVKWKCWKARTVRPVWLSQPQNPKPNENEDHDQERWRPVSFRHTRNGCKNSEKILWMTEFLNTETHTQVLMDYL